MIKRSIQEEEIIIVNTYALNIGTNDANVKIHKRRNQE